MDLKEFFTRYQRVAIAFSGGVDSAYLLYAALDSGAEVKAYYVKTQFQPEFELEDAKCLAKQLSADLNIIEKDILSVKDVTDNPVDRCYYCKRQLFNEIVAAASADGFDILLDGTNASDDFGDRPGMRVLNEMGVYSPLRICGLTKAEIRRLSKEAGLFTWDKPAYACLATRIPTGMTITANILAATEKAEESLKKMGFSDFRVRLTQDGTAKIQLCENQFTKVLEHRSEILQLLSADYAGVTLDLKER